jgi:dihydrofolate synthase/folylpolyglutamate synthase
LLEVGLGGRLDATNAVDGDLSVIVSIDLDHTKTLGPTLEQIAGEKAGIIKPGKPVISGVLHDPAVSVLKQVCRERGSPLLDAREAVRLDSENPDSFTLETDRARYPDLHLSLEGRHQIDNARVALAVFELLADRLGIESDPDAVRDGLASVRWTGRLQWLPETGRRPRMLFDGAHNPAGSETLAAYLRGLPDPAPVVLFGAMHGKLLPSMLDVIAPLAHTLVITRPDVNRAADPEEIGTIARERADSVEVVPEPARALERASEIAGRERFVLVTGSLYLVGEILGLLEERAVPGPVSM